MKFDLDDELRLKSPFNRLDTRAKLIGFLFLIFALAQVDNQFLLLPMLGVSFLIYRLSKLPISFLIKQFRYPSCFLLGILILVPMMGRTVVFQIAWFKIYEEGCWKVLVIVSRFISLLTISIVCFRTSKFLDLVAALRSLGLSIILVDMILLSYRYLDELYYLLMMMQRSANLRGFNFYQFRLGNLWIIASMLGSLLIKSYEKSQLVYHAMLLRGYHQGLKFDNSEHKFDLYSWLFLLLIMITGLLFIWLELNLD